MWRRRGTEAATNYAKCIVAHDVTERRLMDQRLRNTVNRLLALYDAGRILGSSLQQETIGATLVEIVRRVADSSAALIYVQDSSERLRVLYASDPKDLADHLRETPAAEAARRAALDAGDRRLFDSWDLGGSPIVGLIVPLRVRARSVGALEVYGSKGLAENETVETIACLANQAASALENARLFEQLAEHQCRLQNLVQQMLVVQEEERRRVAYEVHDGLTQMAVAAYQRLQAFAEDHPPDSANDREELDETAELLQQTVGEARRVIAGLRPTALDDLGLVAAIRQQVETMLSEGWQIEYEQNLGNVRLSPTAEIALFRVTQEALTNVRRHAHTTRAHVSLERQDKTVRLRVRDQGQGFQLAELESESGPGERVGLSSMRERVALLGGNFEVRSQSRTGTSITVEIPLMRRVES